MPSQQHEIIVELFRNAPRLAPEILSTALGVELPDYSEAELRTGELKVTSTEYRADLVVLLENEEPVLGIIVEVQLAPDPNKRWSWPVYLTALRERVHCPTCLFIVCTSDSVARWASEPILLGPGGSMMRPYVLGPSGVPVITDVEQATRFPELAVLSTMAHGRGEAGFEIGRTALAGISHLDDVRLTLYTDEVLAAMNESSRKALVELMQRGRYEYKSEFARKYFGEGLAEGEARGKAEGKAEGLATSVIAVLQARGIDVPSSLKNTILACRDLEQLNTWLNLAAVAESVEAFNES